MKFKTRKSWVWNYFEPYSLSSAKCNLCSRPIKRKNSATTGMIKHLEIHDVFEDTAEKTKVDKKLSCEHLDHVEKSKLSEDSKASK